MDSQGISLNACLALWEVAANDTGRRLVEDGGGISVIE